MSKSLHVNQRNRELSSVHTHTHALASARAGEPQACPGTSTCGLLLWGDTVSRRRSCWAGIKAFLSLSSPHAVPANAGRCRHVRRWWGSESSLGGGGSLNPVLCTCGRGRRSLQRRQEHQGMALCPAGCCRSQRWSPEWRPEGPLPPASPHGGPTMSFSPICEAGPRRL